MFFFIGFNTFSDKVFYLAVGIAIFRFGNFFCFAIDNLQAKNSRQCHYQTINGEKLCLAEIARKYNISYGTVKDRYAHGKRGNQLISKGGICNA